MINRVVLVGRLGSDPELRVTPSGHSVTDLRLAVKRVRAQAGQPDTDWIDVVAWSKSAEFAANYLKKGYLVGVDGRIQVDEWQSQSGEKRRSVKVVADSIQNLQPRDRDGGSSYSGGGQSQASPAPAQSPGPSAEQDIENAFGDSGDDFDPFGDA